MNKKLKQKYKYMQIKLNNKKKSLINYKINIMILYQNQINKKMILYNIKYNQIKNMEIN